MRRFLVASILAPCLCLPAFAATLPELFLKVKVQFRLAAYADALVTLDRLQSASEGPGNESLRADLRPGLVFYRGACLAALGRTEEARSDFQEFLTYSPSARLDPSAYPPRVIAALEEARKGGSAKADPGEKASLGASYREYAQPIFAPLAPVDETWAKGPIRYVMTREEFESFERLSDPIARSEFVTEFWRSRDPHQENPENEFREEFEKRMAFADAHFVQDETRGSLTDRGMVFVLLGPPTSAGRRPLRTGEDTADPEGLSRYSQMTGPTSRLPAAEGNYRELWHYRRELLPKGAPYFQVDFDFITRKGYGRNVLQRDAPALATLEAARVELRMGQVAQSASR